MSSTFNDIDSPKSPVNDPPAPGQPSEPRREPPETDPYPVKDPVVPPEPIQPPDLPPERGPVREPDFPTPPEPIPEYPPDITFNKL